VQAEPYIEDDKLYQSKLASWAGVCPGRKESAGVSYSRRSAKGAAWLWSIVSSD
jgi:hypothetical protein